MAVALKIKQGQSKDLACPTAYKCAQLLSNKTNILQDRVHAMEKKWRFNAAAVREGMSFVRLFSAMDIGHFQKNHYNYLYHKSMFEFRASA